MMEEVIKLAKEIGKHGGRAMLVGGCVRDEFLNRPVKDIDVEVYGVQPSDLEKILETFGRINSVGSSFAVYKLGQDIDISLPRREKKVGVGHKGFEVVGDPFMSFEEACSRRDFTINAIMKDPLTEEIVDPLNGRLDLDNKQLKAVSDVTFQEDSLRVLRLAQFASRFNFDISDRTFNLALKTDLSDLPKERVWMEIEKLLMKSPDPSIGVLHLSSLEIDKKLFPSLRLSKHNSYTLEALRVAPSICEDLSYPEKLTVLLCLFCHYADISALDEMGVTSVKGYNVRREVERIMMNMPHKKLESDYEFHKLSQKANLKLMSKVISSFLGHSIFAENFSATIERLGIQEEPVKPIVTGQHLIERGVAQGKDLGDVLKEVYEMQLLGEDTQRLYQRAYYALGLKYQTPPTD